MFVFEWQSHLKEALKAREAILAYLATEGSDECDIPLAEAILDELLDNVARVGPKTAKIAAFWREDGAGVVEIVELEPGWHPTGVAQTQGWGLMVAGAMVDAITVSTGSDGHEHVRAILPIRRRELPPLGAQT